MIKNCFIEQCANVLQWLINEGVVVGSDIYNGDDDERHGGDNLVPILIYVSSGCFMEHRF